MNVSLTNELEDFVRRKVQSGQFPSEKAVVEALLRRFREEDQVRSPEDFIDHEFIEYCTREGDDRVTLEEVLDATSRLPGSLAQVIIEEERAERF